MPANFLIPQTRIDNLVANLKTLQDNIDAIQEDLNDLHQTITQEIGQAITNLQGLISDEETRATGVEGQLRTDLTAETTRATTAEGKKVDKVSTANRVYGTDSTGAQTTYANSSFVHTTGNETISGTKTLNNPVYCINNNAYYHNMSGYTIGTTPSTSYYPNTLILNDKNGQYFGFYGPEMLTNGSYSVRMGVRSQADNTKYSILKVGCLSDGSFYTSAPTPTENTTSSTQIDTVGARNTALGNKVDKVSTANRVYGTDSTGAQTSYDKNSFGKVDDVKVGTTSVVSNKIATLGTMAGETASNYATVTALNNKIKKVTSLPSTQETGVLYCIPE